MRVFADPCQHEVLRRAGRREAAAVLLHLLEHVKNAKVVAAAQNAEQSIIREGIGENVALFHLREKGHRELRDRLHADLFLLAAAPQVAVLPDAKHKVEAVAAEDKEEVVGDHVGDNAVALQLLKQLEGSLIVRRSLARAHQRIVCPPVRFDLSLQHILKSFQKNLVRCLGKDIH